MRGIAVIACLGLLASAPAAAQDCAAPRYVTGVAMVPATPNSMMVPVTIDGVPKMMVLDTGGAISQLSRATLSEFNLPEQRSPMRVFDLEGHISRTRTRVPDLTLGAIDFAGTNLVVDANPNVESSFAGFLSADLLARYDLDIDFGSNRLNLFSPGHCGVGNLYWPSRPAAQVPFTLVDSHITVPVVLDGKPMMAVLDTGAPFTTLSMDTAERVFNLEPADLKMVVPRNDAAPDGMYSHKFSTMTLEGVTVNHPAMLVLPFHRDSSATGRFGGHLQRMAGLPDVIIGMDILRTLHIYVAYDQRTLYITIADKEAAGLLPPIVQAQMDSKPTLEN